MKRRFLLFVGSLLAAAALLWALSEGPRSAGLGVSVAGPNTDWLTPNNVTASDDARATSALAASGVSDLLRTTTYGFGIPAGATINGIVPEFERSRSGAGTCEDFSVRLVKAGVEVGADDAKGGAWPGTDAYLSYFGPTMLGGTTWTSAEINAASFGVSIAAQETGGTNTVSARVDHVRITVYYTAAGGVPKRQILNSRSFGPPTAGLRQVSHYGVPFGFERGRDLDREVILGAGSPAGGGDAGEMWTGRVRRLSGIPEYHETTPLPAFGRWWGHPRVAKTRNGRLGGGVAKGRRRRESQGKVWPTRLLRAAVKAAGNDSADWRG
jgi:hypothetical protein